MLDFVIYESSFVAIFGGYLTFMASIYIIPYLYKMIR